MTPPASTICCAGCGYVAGPADPYPFRCPRTGTDDADHVLTRVLSLDGARFPAGAEANPFLRYRALMHSWHVARARGLPDAAYRDLVASLDASVAAVDGHGFRATPFFRSPELSEALAFSAAGGVWVKDETRERVGLAQGPPPDGRAHPPGGHGALRAAGPRAAAGSWPSPAAGTRPWRRPWWPAPAAGG